MPSSKSHSQNAREISSRIQSGQLQTYFNSLPRGEVKDLTQAVLQDDFGSMADILIRNLSAYGRPLESIFRSVYESQIKQLANSLIEESIDDLEEDIDEAIEEENFDRLSDIAEELDESQIEQISFRGENVQKKLGRILKKVRVPFSLKSRTRKVAKERGFEVDRTTKAGVYELWSNRKPAFAVFHRGKIVTWRTISTEEFNRFKSLKKVKIDYKPTARKVIKETPKIVSRGGKPFSNKEILFVQSRNNLGVNEIYNDYLKKFGAVRPKGELLGEIRRRIR